MSPQQRIARVMDLLEAPPSGVATPLRALIAMAALIAVGLGATVFASPAPAWWLGGIAHLVVGSVSGLLAAAGVYLLVPLRQSAATRLAPLFPALSPSEVENAVVENAKALRAVARAGDALIDTEMRAVIGRVTTMAGTMIASFATDPDNARETRESLPDLLAQSQKLIARYADHEARSAVDDQFGPFRQAVLTELARIEDAFAHRRSQELLEAARETEALSRG